MRNTINYTIRGQKLRKFSLFLKILNLFNKKPFKTHKTPPQSMALAGSNFTLHHSETLDYGKGNLMVKFVSTPGTEVNVIVPPWASTARRTIERPKPVPLISEFV